MRRKGIQKNNNETSEKLVSGGEELRGEERGGMEVPVLRPCGAGSGLTCSSRE
jgi:hypothetical protein